MRVTVWIAVTVLALPLMARAQSKQDDCATVPQGGVIDPKCMETPTQAAPATAPPPSTAQKFPFPGETSVPDVSQPGDRKSVV